MNPYSIRSNITYYNKDAREFIGEEVMDTWEAVWPGKIKEIDNIHITMNSPAMAVEFLDAFKVRINLYFEKHLNIKLSGMTRK